MEGFGSLEVGTDIQRVCVALVAESLLALGECVTKKGIAVGGEHDGPRTEVEGDDADMLAGDMETVDNTIGYILLAHSVYHMGDDDLTGDIVALQLPDGGACGEQTADLVGTLGGKSGFVGLRVVVVVVADETMTVAYHPHLTTDATEDDGRAGETVLGMVGQALEHRLLIMTTDIGGDTGEELLTGGGLRHAPDISLSELHSITAVRAQDAMTVVGLRSAAVDDSNEVRGDDDSVLAFLFGILGDEILFDDFHIVDGSFGASSAQVPMDAADRQKAHG